MKTFKIVIITLLIMSAWNGFAQNAAAGSENKGPEKTTINQNQDENNPAIIPEARRIAGSDIQTMEMMKSGTQELKVVDPESPAVIGNKDSKDTPVSATASDKPNSAEPASLNDSPAVMNPELLKSKKSEL
jgi:hypothetical protein